MVNTTLKRGLSASTPVIFGGSLASSILLVVSASGLGAIIVSSELLFDAIRYAGAAYLLYQGVKLILPSAELANDERETDSQNSATDAPLFRQAFLLGISNPKDILFFIALLPQFVDPKGNLFMQLGVIVISWFVADCLCKLSYGFAARSVSGLFSSHKNQRRLDLASAGLFITVAIGAIM